MTSTRPYSAPVRDDARRETRRRIRAEAELLFLRHGYVSTTIGAVAAAAGVSGRYVQMVFGSKAGLLSEVIQVAVVGDDDDRPLAARDDWTSMLAPGGEQTLRAFALLASGVLERSGALLAVAATAAETEEAIAVLQARSRERRLMDCAAVADRLHSGDWLDPSATPARAADSIYALSSPELFVVLRSQRDFTRDQYADWLAAALVGALAARH